MKSLALLFALLFLAGCTSVVHQGGAANISKYNTRLVLAPFQNATDDENAGRALTALAGTILREHHLPLYQDETVLRKIESAPPGDGEQGYLQIAREAQATHLLIGTVHEYRYKTDLNADPVVGITLRLVTVQNGQTVWQGSSSKVGYLFASLTGTAQKAIEDLVEQLPMGAH